MCAYKVTVDGNGMRLLPKTPLSAHPQSFNPQDQGFFNPGLDEKGRTVPWSYIFDCKGETGLLYE